MKRLILLLLLLSMAWPVAPQSIFRYDIDDGLSHNTVRCVIQDTRGFMWFGTARGLSRFDGHHYKTFYAAEADSTALGNNSVFSLFADDRGDLWVGAADGIYIYRHERNTFGRFAARTAGGVKISTQVNSITDGGYSRIWIGTQGQGVFTYDRSTGELFQNSLHSSMVSTIELAPDGTVYTGSEMGTISQLTTGAVHVRSLYSNHSTEGQRNSEITAMCVQGDTIWFCSSTGSLKSLAMDARGGVSVSSHDHIARNATAIFPYDNHTLWIGTDHGINVFDTSTGVCTRVTDDSNPFSVYGQYINDIYRDCEGGVWIATRYGGVNYIPRRLKTFDPGLSAGTSGESGAVIVNAFCEDAAGNIWVGTWDEGLIYLDGKTGARLRSRHRLPDIKNIQCLMLDGSSLWVGTHSQGVWLLDLDSGRSSNFRHNRDNPSSLSDNSVNVVYRDSCGNVYVGTEWGLNRRDSATGSFRAESRTNNQANISDIMEDSRGYLWFASNNTGLFRNGPHDNSWSWFRHNPGDPCSLVSDRITCLFEDAAGRIWVGTDMGLCYFDRETGCFVAFAPGNTTIPVQTVSSIEQDTDGFLWVSSNAGLLRLDIDNGLLLNSFSHIDGLRGNHFNQRSSMRAADGKLYFGGIDGFNSFYPGRFRNNLYVPRTVITALHVNGREITPDMPSSPLGKAIHVVEKIRLSSRQNSLSFDFSSMSYQSPGQNLYSLSLEGWDAGWSQPLVAGEATYSNMPPGRYRFEVVGSNNDGVWGEPAALDIVIRPPFYMTQVAWLLYAAVLCGAIFGAVRAIDKRRRIRIKEYMAEHEKESYRNKIEFFTNLAHEIRTPLTLIKIPLESIVSSFDGNARTRNHLEIMNKNATHLLGMINQLLDLRKSEEAGYRLTLAPCDVAALVNEACLRFRPTLDIRGIAITADIPAAPTVFNVDVDAMCKIVDNLMSNASKYAAGEIRISLTADDAGITLTVSDDGEGIASDGMQEKIFEAFYQADGSKAGTGIGLPLTKTLVEKHGGTIAVASQKGLGASFTVSIPRLALPADAAAPAELSESDKNEIDLCDVTDENTSVLIVEDNDELRGLLVDIIGRHYRVLSAENGRAALQILEDSDVDIIVSDIMMPEMDGYQLTEFVKSNIRYSHIPVIQLTARTSMKDRMKGLEYGSDAYIEKPFSSEHLLCQIANLLENRRRLREVYRHATLYGGNVPAGGTNDRDDKFIEKLNLEIDRNIQNENFYLDTLAESLCMSRSNFYRKIKSLFGVSPNEYLRRYRLKKAAEMLRGGHLQASDIYMLVGFNSLSYFSTCFKNYYGASPTKYVEKPSA